MFSFGRFPKNTTNNDAGRLLKLVENIRVNDSLARLRSWYLEQPASNSPLLQINGATRRILYDMDFSLRRQYRYNAQSMRMFGGFNRQFIFYRDMPFVAYIVPVESTRMFRNIKTQKSKAQKLRDQQRMQHFLERKSVCAVMPFSDNSNEELSKFMPKFNNNSDYDPVKECMLDSLETAWEKNDTLKEEICKLKDDNEELMLKLSEEQSRNQELEDTHLTDDMQIKELQCDIIQEQLKCATVQKDKEELKEVLIREKCVNMGHKSHILSLEAQITELKKSTKPVAGLKPESAEVAKFGMYAIRSYPPIVFEDPNATTKKMCRQCGRSDGHPPARCKANNVVCLNCRTYGRMFGVWVKGNTCD